MSNHLSARDETWIPAVPEPGSSRAGFEGGLEQLHVASFGWAMACCRWDRTEAEGVLQSAYLKALEGRARFNGHSSLRTWFFGVVRNTAAERRRARVIRGDALLGWLRREPEPEPEPTPERQSDRAEACRRLRRALSRLSSRQHETLHLVFYQELTVEQAAEVLHVSVGTARTHYQRGKSRLRRLLEEDGS